MTPGSASGSQCFAPMRLLLQSKPAAISSGRIKVNRLVAEANRSRRSYGYGCSKPDSIGQWLPAGPLPTWPNPQRFCRDALNRNRGRRNAHRDSPSAHLSGDRNFSRTFRVGILLHDFAHTNVPLKRVRVSKAWRGAISHCFWAIPLGRFPQEVATPLFRH